MRSKLTIFIPTHYRHAYLARILDYYSSIDTAVFVIDSSREAYSGKIPKNTDYYHCVDKPYMEKLNSVTEIKTKYTVICPDDDFISPKAMQACVDFLEVNNDYSSAQGRYVSFKVANQEVKAIPVYFHSRDIDCDKIEDRITKLFSRYFTVYYGLHETKTLATAFSLALSAKAKSSNLLELLVNFITVIYGKLRVLPIFYCARQAGDKSGGVNRESVERVVSKSEYADEYKYIIDGLALLIEENENVDRSQAKQAVLAGMDAYLHEFMPWYRSQNKGPQNYHLPQVIKKIAPKRLIEFVKAKMPDRHFEQAITAMTEHSGYPFYDEEAKREWEKIKYYIQKHHI
jgi:glycosyltransferase domain-containing protein